MDYRGHKIKIWSVVEAGFILLLFLSLPLTGQTQNDNEIIRVGTDLVSVPFSVYGRDGKYVTGLRSEEIRLFENGVEQTIRFFQPTEEPITVMLLVDVSASMITHMPEMGKAMDLFIDNLRPNDTIVVAYFAAEPQIDIRIPPTKKSAYKYSKPSNPPRTGRSRGSLPTLTFDAVHEAIKYMNAFKGRRAVVLFGDSDLSGFNATAKSNLRRVVQSFIRSGMVSIPVLVWRH